MPVALANMFCGNYQLWSEYKVSTYEILLNTMNILPFYFSILIYKILEMGTYNDMVEIKIRSQTFKTTSVSVKWCTHNPGIMKATLSKVVANCSGEQQFSWSSGICWVKHIRGPSAQRHESKSTDKLPETAICPYNRKIKKIK